MTYIDINVEQENTPAKGAKTLYVVGRNHDKDELLEMSRLHGCGQIRFGARGSFAPNTNEEWIEWDKFVSYFLNQNIFISVELDVKYAEEMLENGWTEHNNFIPLVTVNLPYINQLGYNAVVRIADNGKKTNTGVWCHQLHDLMDRSKMSRTNE